MRISSVHAIRNNQYKGLGIYRQNFSNKVSNINKLDQNDVFVRLAAASTKDARIEKELYEMKLI